MFELCPRTSGVFHIGFVLFWFELHLLKCAGTSVLTSMKFDHRCEFANADRLSQKRSWLEEQDSTYAKV